MSTDVPSDIRGVVKYCRWGLYILVLRVLAETGSIFGGKSRGPGFDPYQRTFLVR
jgi:hypothetical protein